MSYWNGTNGNDRFEEGLQFLCSFLWAEENDWHEVFNEETSKMFTVTTCLLRQYDVSDPNRLVDRLVRVKVMVSMHRTCSYRNASSQAIRWKGVYTHLYQWKHTGARNRFSMRVDKGNSPLSNEITFASLIRRNVSERTLRFYWIRRQVEVIQIDLHRIINQNSLMTVNEFNIS